MRRIDGAYLADGVVVTGDVTLGTGVNLWYGVVIRGDVAPVVLGERVNIQDGCIVHCDFDVPHVIEAGVVAGHGAILHGRRVGADTLVGMGATLLGGSEVGAECIIAAGSLVPERKVIPPRSVVMGVPGKVVRVVTDAELAHTRMLNARYLELAGRYARGEYPPRGGRP